MILPQDQWERLAERLHEAGVEFEIPSTTRFKGEPGEQSTMFFYDPPATPSKSKVCRYGRVFAT